MRTLFAPVKIANIEVPNRFVRSATYDAGADKNFVSDWQIDLYGSLAKGGIGLIISGTFQVIDWGDMPPMMNLLTDDKFVPGLKKLADAVHRHGSKLAVQLFHSGREAWRLLQAKGMEAMGPSAVRAGEELFFKGSCRGMTSEEILAVVNGFASAARRAREAGCDAVQIHAAHAYLPAQFLSPWSNHREDEWGGALENRLRLHKEIYRAIRAEAGPGYPVLIKLGVCDGFPGGLPFEEGLEAAVQLADLGYDSIEVSQGLRGVKWEQTEMRDKVIKREREAYFREWTRQVKKNVNVPVMMVGGLRSVDLMEEVAAVGETDFVCLSRPLVREPDLVASWFQGKTRRPACISCNKCFEEVIKGKRLCCWAGRGDHAKKQ